MRVVIVAKMKTIRTDKRGKIKMKIKIKIEIKI